MTLDYKHEVENGVSKVFWHGSISEDWSASISKLPDLLQDKAEFYLTNIITINSIGIRMWTQFIKEVSVNREIEFYDCPALIIRMYSMSDTFNGVARTKSFFINLECPNCESEMALKFSVSQEIESIIQECNQMMCRTCQKEMELQDDIETFEDFLTLHHSLNQSKS